MLHFNYQINGCAQKPINYDELISRNLKNKNVRNNTILIDQLLIGNNLN